MHGLFIQTTHAGRGAGLYLFLRTLNLCWLYAVAGSVYVLDTHLMFLHSFDQSTMCSGYRRNRKFAKSAQTKLLGQKKRTHLDIPRAWQPYKLRLTQMSVLSHLKAGTAQHPPLAKELFSLNAPGWFKSPLPLSIHALGGCREYQRAEQNQ